MDELDYRGVDSVAAITLNRPERKNAFTLEMVDRWAAALSEARSDPAVRVLVLTGAGDAFCSGIDLGRRAAGESATPIARKELLTERVHRIPLALEDFDKPVIAAINGVVRRRCLPSAPVDHFMHTVCMAVLTSPSPPRCSATSRSCCPLVQ